MEISGKNWIKSYKNQREEFMKVEKVVYEGKLIGINLISENDDDKMIINKFYDKGIAISDIVYNEKIFIVFKKEVESEF